MSLSFPQNVLWKLAHSEGEIVFDRFCDLGFHHFALLNGPGALGAREERAAECFWKASGGKQPGARLHVYPFSLSAPLACCSGTVTHTDHVWTRRGSGCTRPIKTSRLMEGGQEVHAGLGDGHEHPPATAGEWFPTANRQCVLSKLQTIPIFPDFWDKHEDFISCFPGRKPWSHGNWLTHICFAGMHLGQQRSAWLKQTTVLKLISNIAVVLWNQIITSRTCNIPTFRNTIRDRWNSRDFGTESFFHFIFRQYSKLNIFQNILTQQTVTFAFIQMIYHQHSPSLPQQYQ